MTDQQLPDRNGDVIDDIVIALTRRGDLSPEHRAFYESILDRFEGLTRERDRLRTAWTSARRRARQQRDALRDAMAADRDQVRRTRDRYREERNNARREVAELEQARDAFAVAYGVELGRARRLQRQIDAHECVPTQWAYDQACAALERHRQRADTAEQQLAATTNPDRAEEQLAADARPTSRFYIDPYENED